MDWYAADGVMKKLYKGDDPTDWSGLIWHGNGTNVPGDIPVCELCEQLTDNAYTLTITLAVSSTLMLVITILGVALFIYYQHHLRQKLVLQSIIDWQSITFKSEYQTFSNITLGNIDRNTDQINQVGEYKGGSIVLEKLIDVSNFNEKDFYKYLGLMKIIIHDNLVVFIGISAKVPEVYSILRHMQRGSLYDLISASEGNLMKDFKVSFVTDILAGMEYLHQSPIGCHGNLTSKQCLIDSKWAIKIKGYGLEYVNKYHTINVKSNEELLWTAPESLRYDGLHITKQADVYSFGILMQEILLETEPYDFKNMYKNPDVIITKVRAKCEPPFRPQILENTYLPGWTSLMMKCWDEDEQTRPDFKQIISIFLDIIPRRSLNLTDNMIKRLEKHTRVLEDTVIQRMTEIEAEKDRMEIILCELLPKDVASKLTQGKLVKPEFYECVTLFFSDIVGFTAVCTGLTPLEVVHMLNEMYTLFDDISQTFEVYKVATIGDAYVVASGVPHTNGIQHAVEICTMAVEVLVAIQAFAIPGHPGQHLRLRIGIHSGACVAAVVGIKMPRYLLFGDTIDITEFMESSGQPMRIHISETTKDILSQHDTHMFLLTKDNICVKGQYCINSYFLEKKV